MMVQPQKNNDHRWVSDPIDEPVYQCQGIASWKIESTPNYWIESVQIDCTPVPFLCFRIQTGSIK